MVHPVSREHRNAANRLAASARTMGRPDDTLDKGDTPINPGSLQLLKAEPTISILSLCSLDLTAADAQFLIHYRAWLLICCESCCRKARYMLDLLHRDRARSAQMKISVDSCRVGQARKEAECTTETRASNTRVALPSQCNR
jgi:hypothetical protein